MQKSNQRHYVIDIKFDHNAHTRFLKYPHRPVSCLTIKTIIERRGLQGAMEYIDFIQAKSTPPYSE